jgi:uncharacterized BrkB/YihY/UPF0761 family membrane protein
MRAPPHFKILLGKRALTDLHSFAEDQILALAAGVAFYGLLAPFQPLVLLSLFICDMRDLGVQADCVMSQ